MKYKITKILIMMAMCTVLCGCVTVSDSTSSSVEQEIVEVKEDVAPAETEEPVAEEAEAPKKIEASAKEQKELCDLVDAYCSMLVYRAGTYTPTAQNAIQYWDVMYYYKVNGYDPEDQADIVSVYIEDWGGEQPYARESSDYIAHASKALFSDFSSFPSLEDAGGITQDGNNYLFMMGDRGDETVEMTGFEYTDDGKAILTLDHYIGSERVSSVTATLIPNEHVNESMKVPFRYAVETIEIKDAN